MRFDRRCSPTILESLPKRARHPRAAIVDRSKYTGDAPGLYTDTAVPNVSLRLCIGCISAPCCRRQGQRAEGPRESRARMLSLRRSNIAARYARYG